MSEKKQRAIREVDLDDFKAKLQARGDEVISVSKPYIVEYNDGPVRYVVVTFRKTLTE